MTRVKRGITVKRKHKALLESAKGYRGTKSRQIKSAHEAILHAGEYAFTGRKAKKRDFRALWINRINQAARNYGTTYRELIHQLSQKKIIINRKMLAELVVSDINTFKKIVEKAKI